MRTDSEMIAEVERLVETRLASRAKSVWPYLGVVLAAIGSIFGVGMTWANYKASVSELTEYGTKRDAGQDAAIQDHEKRITVIETTLTSTMDRLGRYLDRQGVR